MIKSLDHTTLPQAVRAGLKAGEFSVYYQPKFDPDSEDVVGLEAFLRWHHPGEGFQEAASFMPAIERSAELSHDVDEWVLGETTRQGKQWLDDGLSFGALYVNVSSWNTGQPLVATVETALKTSRFPAKSLALECPWRMLTVGADAIGPTMHVLRKLGCTLVLDGNPLDTECVKLASATPVQQAKVCIKYITEFSQRDDLKSLNALVKKWKNAGIQIIAMGVENALQVDLARQIGCRFTQGNNFKKPLPADEIHYLLRIIADTKKSLSLI